MSDETSTAPVRVAARAKINLHLRILGTRPDGYHDVVTVLQTLDLQDAITCEFHEGFRFELRCDDAAVPRDETNLVWRAAQALADAARPEGIAGTRVTIEKRIPMQAGLGGGSADAAAALVGLARLWALDVDRATLRAVARGLGADVAFLVDGGTQLGVGRGDELAVLAPFPSRAVALVMPPFGVSTAEAYRWHDERVAAEGGPGAAVAGAAASAAALAAELPFWPVASADAGTAGSTPAGTDAAWAAALSRCVNDFERAIGPRHAEIPETVAALRAAGAELAAMTGSGAAVFGLFADEVWAETAVAGFAGRPGWRTFVTRTAP